MEYNIYCLIDPFTYVIKYVSKTSLDLEARLSQHLIEKKNEPKRQWIEDLSKRMKVPLIKSLELTSEELSSEREQFWVEFYHKAGCNLYNNRLLKKLQTFEELEWFKKNREYLSINRIEKAIGLPITTLDKALKGRGLPATWHEPFKKWVNDFLTKD